MGRNLGMTPISTSDLLVGYVWAYWILSPVTTVLAIPRFINRLIVGRSGTWTSPERTNLDGTEDDK